MEYVLNMRNGTKRKHYSCHGREGERGGERRWERKWKKRGVGGGRGRKWNKGRMDREVSFFSNQLGHGEELDQQADIWSGSEGVVNFPW